MSLMESQPIRLDKVNDGGLNIQLIKGTFNLTEAFELITMLIQVKITFHEQKLNMSTLTVKEQEISRQRIEQLEEALYEAKKHLALKDGQLEMNCNIQL